MNLLKGTSVLTREIYYMGAGETKSQEAETWSGFESHKKPK